MTAASENPVEALFQRAEQAMRERREAVAIGCYRQILVHAPEHPRALNALGNRALSGGDAKAAREFFERAVAQDPLAAPIWLNLAMSRRQLGDHAAELAALDRALEADPYFVIALLQKAQWFERFDRRPDAVRVYRSLLQAAPPLDTLPPAMRTALAHAQSLVTTADADMEAAVRTALVGKTVTSTRFNHALEIMGGRRQIYLPKPAGLHFPYLPAVQFFDRTLFPWFERLEAATPVIRRELIALISDGDPNEPYVNIAAGQPENQWHSLNHSLDWGAIFLWKNGQPVTDTLNRCPETATILRSIPMLDIPARGPTVMFSTLRPHTRIPPHHGVTNIRSVVHLPLIVPDGCAFRVGSETRPWHEGSAWAFDDTIEHEAWNDSDHNRVILIIDAWNPYLDAEERELISTTNEVLGRLGRDHT